MKKRFFWIYVLPVLMVTTVIGFGVLGVKSAVSEQKMRTELEKIEWKMDAVETTKDTRPMYRPHEDLISIHVYSEKRDRIYTQWFSSDPVILTEEELFARLDAETDNWTPGKDAEYMRETFGEDILIWTDFSEGLALLYYRDKLVCAKEDGTVVFEKKASIPESYIEGGTSETTEISRGLNRDGFRDGLAVFTLDGCKYGILDREGNVLIEPVFKGKNTLTVMKNHHVGFFYEKEFRIGEIDINIGGERSE